MQHQHAASCIREIPKAICNTLEFVPTLVCSGLKKIMLHKHEYGPYNNKSCYKINFVQSLI